MEGVIDKKTDLSDSLSRLVSVIQEERVCPEEEE